MCIDAIITDIIKCLKYLNEHVNRIMILSGYYRHNGIWLKYGKATMRQLKKYAKGDTPNWSGVAHATEREKARRNFLGADDVRVEVERVLGGGLYDFMALAIIREITDMPDRQQAYLAALQLTVDDLLEHWGCTGDPWVEMHARRAVHSDFCLWFASSIVVPRMKDPKYTAKVSSGFHSIAFHASRSIKDLAGIVGVGVEDVKKSMNKFKIVG